MSDTVIKVAGVSKKYCRTLKHTMLYGATDLARSFLGLNGRAGRLRKGEFWAVKDVSFELKKGECLGIIGLNGSGKSTLLKMLNGIFMPDTGSIEINGRVGALIEVVAGFHPMLTGRENIYINGAIMGMGKREIDRKFDSIVDFAGIGEFIDSPVKHYSSGMYVRLGFAIAAHAAPDILLVDEVLAVGDTAFQMRCFDMLNRLKGKGLSMIIVSHDMNAIAQHADNALMLNEGKVYSNGKVMEVISAFRTIMKENYVKTSHTDLHEFVERFGSGEIEIVDAVLLDETDHPVEVLYTGKFYTFRVSIFFNQAVNNPIVGFILKSSSNLRLHNTHTFLRGKKLGYFKQGQHIEVSLKFRNNMLNGVYSLTPALSYSDGSHFFDYRNSLT